MTDLTDRMRTCAAHIQACSPSELMIIDAATLLIEAAIELEKPVEIRLGTPIPIQAAPGLNAAAAAEYDLKATWTDPCTALPTQPLSKNACPNCDSRATKTVNVKDRIIWLECPVCNHAWKR